MKINSCVFVFGLRIFFQVEYYLKWNGYSDSENTWEPEENLDCPDLIQAFEDARKKREAEGKAKNGKEEIGKKRKGVSPVPGDKTASAKKKTPEEKKLQGFDRGLEPEKILGKHIFCLCANHFTRVVELITCCVLCIRCNR